MEELQLLSCQAGDSVYTSMRTPFLICIALFLTGCGDPCNGSPFWQLVNMDYSCGGNNPYGLSNGITVGPTAPSAPVVTAIQSSSGGTTATNQNGNYGIQGTPNASNIPGSRSGGASWSDTSGHLWLFGGIGFDSVGTEYELNDLWDYSIATGEWTWVGGSNIQGASGVYGVQGVANPANIPGARDYPSYWTDASGTFWMFGGQIFDSLGNNGDGNDLWKYSTATGEWTWVSGSDIISQHGTYGTLGVANPANVPGARYGAYTWIDASGKFWLFGGYGWDAASGSDSYLNDLWMFNPATTEWTWEGGSNVENQTTGIMPGGREAGANWIDSSGNLWLFGGYGFDAFGSACAMSDLWKYSGGVWSLVLGSPDCGTSSSNAPSGRFGPAYWVDPFGNFWIFGGMDTNPYNDLWEFNPSFGWVQADAVSIPARYQSAMWNVGGNEFLFGGAGDPVLGLSLTDLWEIEQ